MIYRLVTVQKGLCMKSASRAMPDINIQKGYGVVLKSEVNLSPTLLK